MAEIGENIERVKEKIAAAAARAGRDSREVELLVVTKSWPPEIVREAVDTPHLLFGESKVQEAAVKIPLLPSRVEWHLIGHLQKNKVRKAISLFTTIHSIDSLELAKQVDSVAGELGRYPDIYLQVNIAGEASKHGFSPEGLRIEIEPLLALEQIRILGLMLIPPFDPDPEHARPCFAELRELRDELEGATGVPFPKLSMGMSHDYEVAVEEGATIVRVGTAILGRRRKGKR